MQKLRIQSERNAMLEKMLNDNGNQPTHLSQMPSSSSGKGD